MKTINYFKALSDETRLRILNILLENELNVNEIVSVLNMGQPRISRHLKILSDGGLLTSRRDGLWIFYKAPADGDGKKFIDSMSGFIRDDDNLESDMGRLKRILDEREEEKKEYFNKIAPDWDKIKSNIVGDINITAEIETRVNGADVIADLGCGTGELLLALCKNNGAVIGIDRSAKMLDEARLRLPRGSNKVELRLGEMEHLPMREKEAGGAVINMVLHYLVSPVRGIKEANRVIGKGGSLIIVDFDKHKKEDMRIKYGHRWLGFSKKEMEGWLGAAGFKLKDVTQFDAKQDLKINLFHAVKEKAIRSLQKTQI
ncbi:ArsR/SmtB family transcription factor [Spirochaetota bacterium]